MSLKSILNSEKTLENEDFFLLLNKMKFLIFFCKNKKKMKKFKFFMKKRLLLRIFDFNGLKH